MDIVDGYSKTGLLVVIFDVVTLSNGIFSDQLSDLIVQRISQFISDRLQVVLFREFPYNLRYVLVVFFGSSPSYASVDSCQY